MKTLQNNQKTRFNLLLLGTSLFATTLFSGDIKPSFADIKSQITQNERASILKKRDNLSKNIAERELLYVSNIIDISREAIRPHRLK